MIVRNPIMLRKGMAPAAEVAKHLKKGLSTVHRMVDDGRVDGSRDGRALYIDVDSLIAYFAADGNDVMADASRALKEQLPKLAEEAERSMRSEE